MAAGYLGAPGTAYGPCVEPCQHLDCKWNRDMSAAICRLCEKPIGYDSGFFEDGPDSELDLCKVLVHAPCLYKDIGV